MQSLVLEIQSVASLKAVPRIEGGYKMIIGVGNCQNLYI